MSALAAAALPPQPGQPGQTAIAGRVVARLAARAVAEVEQAGGAAPQLAGVTVGRQTGTGVRSGEVPELPVDEEPHRCDVTCGTPVIWAGQRMGQVSSAPSRIDELTCAAEANLGFGTGWVCQWAITTLRRPPPLRSSGASWT